MSTPHAPITRSRERDAYIMAQALWVAAREMRKVPHPMREASNIRDMERMLDVLFPHYKAVFELGEEEKR